MTTRDYKYTGPQPWAEGTTNYNIRVGILFTVYALYTVFVISTLALFIIKARYRHSGLYQRSVKLVTIQAVGGFLIGTNGLVSTALNKWPCFLKLWLFDIGFTLLLTAVSARAVQLIVVSKIHSLNSQLSTNDMPVSGGPPRLSSNRRHAQQLHDAKKRADAGTEVYGGSEYGPPGSFPGSVDRMSSTQMTDVSYSDGHQARALVGGASIEEKRVAARIMPPPSAAGALVDNEPWMRLYRRLQWYSRLQGYTTDRAMIIYVITSAAIVAVVTLVVNIVNKQFSIRPLGEYCPFLWGFMPVTGIIVIYLVVVCPALLVMAWKLNDAYGIRNDLIICDTIGIVCAIMTILWETTFRDLSWAWSSMFYMWVAVFVIHVSSVALPLWRSIRHAKKVAWKLGRGRASGSLMTAVLAPNSDRDDQAKRADFNKMLDDAHEYQMFREYAASCFCSELTAFVDEYQSLKALTIMSLGREEYSVETSDHLQTPLMMSTIDSLAGHHGHGDPVSQLAMSNHLVDSVVVANARSLNLQTNATVSILDTARAVYPQYRLTERTTFPSALMDKLVTIFSVYINSSSYTAVNVPPIMVRRIREKLSRREMYLTILDEVKDEVLFMLYADVYTRFATNN
ncbi:hypothetical protein GQ54DRAFT_296815 [Martensiomyces pterosporus]|nr:hypothetical protein GQ54DRAFT_296815 [Martensiomyces pterosporus]